jgi:hypothetical protein
MKIHEYQKILTITPSSGAIVKLSKSLSYGLNSKVCINESRKLLWMVNGWTIECHCRGIGLIIDGWIGELYSELIDCLDRLGATKSLDYVKRAQEICGGSVPVDEIERAHLIQKHEKEFDQLDSMFNTMAREEAAELLVKYLRADLNTTFLQLGEPTSQP